MTRDGGTAKGALIACRRDHDYPAPKGLIERLVQRLFPFSGRLSEGEAQVDYACPGVDTFDDRRRKLLGCRTRHLFSARGLFRENRAD